MWPEPGDEQKDAFVQQMSSRLHRLRAAKPSTSGYAREVAALFAVLDKRRDFVTDQDLWTELYHRSVLMYPGQTRLAGIPYVNVTKHNHVVTFYMALAAPAGLPVVHFDTHSDLGPFDESRRFVRAAAAADRRTAQALCSDIGAAMTGVLLLPGPPRDIVWVTPAWIPDPEGTMRYWKHTAGSRNVVLATCDTSAHHSLTNARLYRRQAPCTGPSGAITTLSLDRGNPDAQIAKLLAAVPTGGFLLDVDLDYFVCNGQALRRDAYLRTGYDVASPGRAQMRELTSVPRNTYYKRSRQFYDLSRSINREVRLILQRLRSFERQLRALRAAGRRPAAISICDSTGVLFTPCTSCTSTTNGYLPQYYAAFVNQRVLAVLQRVYGRRRFSVRDPQ